MTPDIDRFLDDLKTLRQFGGDSETKGVRRPAFSDADLEARVLAVRAVRRGGAWRSGWTRWAIFSG
jgi:hypothetical protein